MYQILKEKYLIIVIIISGSHLESGYGILEFYQLKEHLKNMEEKDKQLLLKDLSARLPYDVIVNDGNEIDTLKAYMLDDLMFIDEAIIRPYLRPMSSMTEEEKEEYLNLDPLTNGWFVVADWCNFHHFDYRGLIKKGLAIEASEGMYKTE